ncbi:MAG: hypothetical protein IH576_00880 [Deltaproteobacteria bacterium]|nr:hypothetical protein [Deltaproteobacteria bacterium]
MGGKRIGKVTAALLLSLCFASWAAGRATAQSAEGRWMAGDFHFHTLLTDGGRTPDEVALHASAYGLDWFAFSEHGGNFGYDQDGKPFPERIPRWITLKYFSFPIVLRLRAHYPEKRILLGLEWNVPAHEHASVGIVSDDPAALSDFEYACDAADMDTSRALPKRNRTHQDAVACVASLGKDHPGGSYFLPNHPSRALGFTAADLREFNDAAPGVAFGFEGIPGHQKAQSRGGYYSSFREPSETFKARTHGGADYMAAKVGGTWDALLGEGRRFFLFANSDFHDTKGSFWPGEYAKSHTFVKGDSLAAVVDGMRSGNSFAVLGDLIDALSFTAGARDNTATMGETLTAERGDRVWISVAFRSPEANNNGDAPRVDHIDVIAGNITERAEPGTDAYRSDANPTARVVARIAERDWTCENGWCRSRIDAGPAARDMYFRLRGTNLPPSVPGETDAEGNPLSDDMACGEEQLPPRCNTAEKAYADLWFYSNPIFVDVLTGEGPLR